MKILHYVAFILTIVGALNWGLVGLGSFFGFDGNLVYLLVGSWGVVENTVYVLVGLSAIWLAVSHRGDCKACTTNK